VLFRNDSGGKFNGMFEIEDQGTIYEITVEKWGTTDDVAVNEW
jgi:hypothetical protein